MVQSRTYFPPHRTQLHPRMHINSLSLQTSNKCNTKCLILLIAFLTIPFLFYLFSTAQKIHHSPKFSHPKSQFFSIVIDSARSASRIRVYQLLSEGLLPFGNGQMPLAVGSFKVRRGLAEDPENAGGLISGLLEFAKGRVPKKEWADSKVQLLASGEEVEKLEMVLESCRGVLRHSGFAFKDDWATIIQDKEKGVYAWVAVNYALGTLGDDPQKTTGIVELGATSLQATFASKRAKRHSLHVIKLAGVTYNLQTQSFPKFSQDAAWDTLNELHNSRQLISLSNNRVVSTSNPCIPKGYEIASSKSEAKLLLSDSAGNFTACRLEVLASLNNQQEKCLRRPCSIVPSFFLELQGNPILQESLFYTSEFFGLVPRSTLFELEAAGKHFCEGDWEELKSQHHGIDDLDLIKYCFSSAYTVALLHDKLGIPMSDNRIGFANHSGSYPVDWTVGAFIVQSMLEPSDMEIEDTEEIVGNELVTYFSLFAFLLIALLAVLFVVQLRKPQLKTIYDLQKGHYIVTRVPR
ncbi:probable apyrase 6 [Mercurialis annua]|uniref:probable apyrase 6 n=1 Tax=Mercurialis annua TaxID=3986 RepID=UPI00215F050A|nr:probable apyrase 6 [Mercurialis annua]